MNAVKKEVFLCIWLNMKIHKITWILYLIYITMLCTGTLSAFNTSLNEFLFRLLVLILFMYGSHFKQKATASGQYSIFTNII